MFSYVPYFLFESRYLQNQQALSFQGNKTMSLQKYYM